MKKRVLSVLIILSLCLGFVPQFRTPEKVHAETGAIIDHSQGHPGLWTSIASVGDLNALFASGGSGYLTADITVPDSTVFDVQAGTTVLLCLNGKTITFGKSSRFNIHGTFDLYGVEGGTITGGNCSNGGTAYIYAGGTFNMYGGTITNSTAYGTSSGEGLGGAVYVKNTGTFNMYGGTIQNCTAQRYGGAVETYGDFNMYGGTIDNCQANTSDGGGVEVESGGVMTMYGGTISNCKAENTGNNAKGGGVSVTTGTFTMNDGTIIGCKAYNGGGGVYVKKNRSFTFNGGKITNCSATYGGGVNYAGTFTMNGGFIDTCEANRGGGVYGWNNGSFTLNGGIIQNCTVPNKGRGAGVCLIGNADQGRPTMTMTGGTIRNNKTGSDAHGGGVYVLGGAAQWNGKSVPAAAQFTMTGGEISGNYAYWSGGGVFCEAEGSFLMTGGLIKNNTSGGYGSGVGVYQEKDIGDTTSWIYIKGGTISNNTVKKDTKGRAMMWKETVTGSGSCSYNGSNPGNTNVATYDEIKNAVANAPTDGTPVVITLTKNITNDSTGTIKIQYDKNIIINLNGYSLTKTSSSYAWLYPCRCPLYIVNTSSTQSKITGGSYALYLYNGGDGYDGDNAWGNLKAHIIGNIYIGNVYCAGGTWLFYDTADVSIGSRSDKNDSHRLYKVTLDANGGSGAPGKAPDTELGATNSLYLHGLYKSNSGNLALSTTAPNREDYTLKGWNTAADGSGTDYGFTYNNGSGVVPTLYAQWSQDQTLTYNANGHGNAPASETMKYNAATYASKLIPDVSNFMFMGWNTKADGSGTSYAAGAEVKAANVEPTATTLYAQWQAIKYTVQYDANGGEGAPEAQTATYNQSFVLSNVEPTKQGYLFQGWSLLSDADVAPYQAGSEVNVNLTKSETVTLYAVWSTCNHEYGPDHVCKKCGEQLPPEHIWEDGHCIVCGEVLSDPVDPVVPEDPVTIESMILLITLNEESVTIDPKLESGANVSAIYVDDSLKEGASVTLSKRAQLYTIKVIDSNNKEYLRRINLNIVNFASVQGNGDVLVSARTEAQSLINNVVIGGISTVADETTTDTTVRTSQGSVNSLQNVLAFTEEASTQNQIDDAVAALSLAKRSFGWSLRYDAITRNDDGTLTYNAPVAGSLNASVTIEKTIGAIPNVDSFNQNSVSKSEVAVGATDTLDPGLYTFKVSLKVGNVGSSYLVSTIVPDMSVDTEGLEPAAAKAKQMEAGMIAALVEEGLMEKGAELPSEYADLVKGGVGSFVSAANSRFYSKQAPADTNTLAINESNGTYKVTANNALTISLGVTKNGEDGRPIDIVSSTLATGKESAEFTPAKAGTYTVSVIYTNGATKSEVACTLASDIEPAEVKLENDNTISVYRKPGFTVKHVYYAPGIVNEATIKDATKFIDVNGFNTLPVISSNVSIYVEATFYGTPIAKLYTFDNCTAPTEPVIINSNGGVGIYYSNLSNVKAAAYIKGSTTWDVAKKSADVTFIPAQDLLVGSGNFENAMYTFFFFFGNDGTLLHAVEHSINK